MSIFGLSAIEIMILERWQRMVRLPVIPVTETMPFADVYEMRRQWLEAGGNLPVTEAEALFLKPVR